MSQANLNIEYCLIPGRLSETQQAFVEILYHTVSEFTDIFPYCIFTEGYEDIADILFPFQKKHLNKEAKNFIKFWNRGRSTSNKYITLPSDKDTIFKPYGLNKTVFNPSIKNKLIEWGLDEDTNYDFIIGINEC